MSAFQVMESQPGVYIVDTPVTEEEIIEQAGSILKERALVTKQVIKSPEDSRKIFQMNMVDLDHEVFSCLYLDNRHQVIEYKHEFNGTIDGASVYPRVIVKRCLDLGATALVIAHNHPSGVSDPSQADIHITKRLQDALALIDVRLLDHLIIGTADTKESPNGIASLAELGHL